MEQINIVFNKIAADKMAAVIDDWVRRGILGSRSELADARLDYGEPFTTEQINKILDRKVESTGGM